MTSRELYEYYTLFSARSGVTKFTLTLNDEEIEIDYEGDISEVEVNLYSEEEGWFTENAFDFIEKVEEDDALGV